MPMNGALIVSERAEEHLEENVGEQGHQRSDADSNAAPSELSESMIAIHDAMSRGDLISARQLMMSLDRTELSEQDQSLLLRYQDRLKLDPAELYVPIALLTFWILIFIRTMP